MDLISILKRIARIPLLNIIREHLWAVYGRYVFCLSRMGKAKTINFSQQCPLLLVTIAFNHEELIKKQIEMVKHHIKNAPYHHIIVDNSSDNSKRKAIKAVCDSMEVEYFATPRYFTWLTWNALFSPSYSHGAALNWAYYHIIQSSKPKHFVLLDHDIIPIKPFDFIDALGPQDFYGLDRLRECGWYLWPGWCIFRFDAIADKKVDFSPVYIKHAYLDAGGRNFLSIFCNYYRTDLRFANPETKRIRFNTPLQTQDDVYHGDCIQIIDNSWMHIINGSNYARIPGKENLVSDILQNLIKNQ